MSAVTVRTAALAAGMLITALSTSAFATPINLVTNGDFSAGNTGFTSQYNFASSNTSEGEYHVRQNSAEWNPWFIDSADHTGAGGEMLVVNGTTQFDSRQVWSQTFAVAMNTDYTFEAFAMNVCCIDSHVGGRLATADLRFFANDSLLTTLTVEDPGTWIPGTAIWNSGDAQSVTLVLRNINLTSVGNDFAVDDIFFGTSGEREIAAETPEPATWTMLALGGLAAAWAQRRQSRA